MKLYFLSQEEQSATEGDVPFKILNDLSALQFHGVICSVMKQKIDDASWFLSRLKAEHALSTMPGMDVDGETRRDDLILQSEIDRIFVTQNERRRLRRRSGSSVTSSAS